MHDDTGPISQYHYQPQQPSAPVPPPVHQMPDYKPRGMATFDKVMAWGVVVVVLIFVLVNVNRYLTVHFQAPAKPHAVVTAPVTPKAHATKGK